MKNFTCSLPGIKGRSFYLILSLILLFSTLNAQFNPIPDTQRPGDGKGWLDNGTVKIAVNLNYGGAITYFSKSNTNTNTINNADHGRQAQLSVYSGPDNFSQSSPNQQWQGLGWNPIEAGDLQNNAPSVINYANTGTIIYTKVRPLFWPLVNQQAECYIEKWITLDGNAAKVHFRFTNFRSDNNFYSGRGQEIPCFYAPFEFNQHVFYSGNAPFTNAGLTTITSDETGRFEQCSENWMAVQNTSTGEAVGLWSRDFFSFIRSRIGNGSSTGEFGSNCTYFGAAPYLILDGTRTYDWDAAVVGGSIQDIRNYATAQTHPANLPDFQFNGSRQGFFYYSATDPGEPITELNISVNNQSDWNISSPDVFYQSSAFNKLYIRAAFSLNNVNNMTVGWYRYGQGAGNVLDLNQYVTFPIINDGQYRTYEVTLNGNSNWTSAINRLLLFRDPATSGNTTGTVKIDWISHQNLSGCTNPPSAPTIAVTSSATTTCSDGSRTVTLTASGCSGTVTWSNGQTGSSINVTTPGNYSATCTVSNCTSSASNSVSVSNGTDCGGGSQNPAGSYEGHLDGANCDVINGWVWLNGNNHRVIVEILDGSNGDAVIGEITADSYRSDLQAAGKGDGAHGFWFTTPNSVKNGQNHNIKARVKGIGYILTNSPRTINCAGCSAPSAPSISITSSATTTCEDGSRTVTITASGCSGTVTWSNGSTGSSINITAPGNYSATCTVSGCTSAASNTITVSNGSGCGSSSPNPAGSYEGHFDGSDCYNLFGWVWLNNSNHRVVIEILDGSTIIHEMTADGYRSDLQAAGKGDGAHAFWYTTPSSLKDGQNHSLSARVKGIGYLLNNSPRTFNCSGSPAILDPVDPDNLKEEIQLFPNPSGGIVNFRYYMNKDGNVSLRIMDVMGRIKQVRKLQGKTGYNQGTILLNKTVPEIFFVETIIEGKRKVKTMIKK